MFLQKKKMVSHVSASRDCHSQVCKNVTESCEMKENLDLERRHTLCTISINFVCVIVITYFIFRLFK